MIIELRLLTEHVTGNISENTKTAIELSSGEYIGFLDHDDLLSPNALYEVVSTINQNPEIKLIYTDEDKLAEDGTFVCPYFKTDWNYNLFLSQNYLCHFVVIEKKTYHKYGCFPV